VLRRRGGAGRPVTAAALAAGVAAACGVLAAWEALAAAERARPARALAGLLAPVRAAGRHGRDPTAAERRRLAVVATLALFAAGWLTAGPAAGAALAAAGPWALARLVRARRRRWRAALAATAPHAARALADALAAGHAIRGAVASAAGHGGVPEPGRSELRAAAAALAVGGRTDEVLDRLRGRARDPGWDTLVAAVLLQHRAGGDLAARLRTLAGALEEGARVRADAHGATAQARFTAALVAALPLGASVLAELAAPGALAAIAGRPATAGLLAAALVLQAVAFVTIRRLARAPER
jgi:tight adherence protein B